MDINLIRIAIEYKTDDIITLILENYDDKEQIINVITKYKNSYNVSKTWPYISSSDFNRLMNIIKKYDEKLWNRIEHG